MKEKYYLYEPMLNIYEQYVGKNVEQAAAKKWLYVYYINKPVEKAVFVEFFFILMDKKRPQ